MPPVKDRYTLGLAVGGLITSLLILLGPNLLAQFNQSGGGPTAVTITSGTVTANAGTNLNTSLLALESGNLASIKTDVDKIPSQGQALAASSMPVVLTAIQLSALTPPTNVAVYPKSACGSTVASQALAAVPTSATLVFSSTTCMTAVFFENSNSGTQTVTLTDNTGTPLNAIGPAFVVPGLSNMVVPMYGIAFTSGVKWAAGGTGVLGGLIGYQ